MKHRVLVVAAAAALLGVIEAGPAWARADGTATETCGDATTATVDSHAGTSLNSADQRFNRVAGVILGLTCETH